jgi:hypothetical protein
MADFLASKREFMNWLTDPVQQTCKTSAYEHISRNVTVALCVNGLLVTWGTARERGDRDGDDLVLKYSDFSTIDGMTDIPNFGEAMASVSWIIDDASGSVRFPKFFKENETPEGKHRRQAAERQARFRKKQGLVKGTSDAVISNVTGKRSSNVTVTCREEKRREEKKIHIPEGWFPSKATVDGLSTDFGFENGDAERYVVAFKDACAAKGYKYKDFDAAFRNCVRQDWPKFRKGADKMPEPTRRRVAL